MQQAWESSGTGSTTKFFLLCIKDRAFYLFGLNFFLKQARTGHGSFVNTSTTSNLHFLHHAYAVRNVYTPSVSYMTNLASVISDVSSILSHPFLKFAEMVIRCSWKEEQLLQFPRRCCRQCP